MRTGLLRTIRFVLAEGMVARSDTTVDICHERFLKSFPVLLLSLQITDNVIQIKFR